MNHSQLQQELISWRHDLHQIPEVGFEERETSDYLAEKLASVGLKVTRGVGGTGVVGTLQRGSGRRAVGLRADMDALAIADAGTQPYASKHPGRTHACGHDGHMAILLGAARLLSEMKDLAGTVHFVFQPAEEHGRGAKAMIADGLLKRFHMDEIYGLHNMPGLPEGHFQTRPGGILASEDNFVIRVQGKGGHAARPHLVIDPLVIGSEIVLALQTVVSRNLDPTDQAVVSATEFITDGTRNVIPGNVTIKGDTRSYASSVQAMLKDRMSALVAGICAAHGARHEFEYTYEFEPTVNSTECLAPVLAAATEVVGADQVTGDCRPILASEDFGAFLRLVPGNFMFIGSGVDSLPLHNPNFDFNDNLLLPGARYLAAVARMRLGT